MQNLVGPTLVAMATTFALGAESKRLPACLLSLLILHPAYVTKEVQFPLHHSLLNVDACARSFYMFILYYDQILNNHTFRHIV